MNKKECSKLQAMAYAMIDEVINAIKSHTEDEPLVLFEREDADGMDTELLELPFGYWVDRKYSGYHQGAIRVVKGNDVELFGTADDYAEEYNVELNQLPFECLIQLLSHLEERLKP